MLCAAAIFDCRCECSEAIQSNLSQALMLSALPEWRQSVVVQQPPRHNDHHDLIKALQSNIGKGCINQISLPNKLYRLFNTHAG